jgi:CRP/FNR family transcriptional regulator, cyclic AMP receptor protein
MPMPLIPDIAVFQRKLATLPLTSYQAGETVLSAASTTGRLLILKEGAVAVVKEGVEIAKVTEPGAVFGELSALLDQPHSADVRALETSQFHVADAATILRIDPTALLYVATVLAQRLDSANKALLELKRQVRAGEPGSVIGRTVEKIEGLGLPSREGARAGPRPPSHSTRPGRPRASAVHLARRGQTGSDPSSE